VITEPVLIDAGPLVALLHVDDVWHEICRKQADELHGPVYTTWAVITEAAWLLRGLPDSLDRLLAALDEFEIELLHVPQDALRWLRRQARQYHDLRPQAADLTLLHLAEQTGAKLVFTLDRRDFAVYRDSQGQSLRLLPDVLPIPPNR